MRRDLCIAAIGAFILMLLTLAACGAQPAASPTPDAAMFLATPIETTDQATLAAALTQEKNNADNQAAATAEIVRAKAQATLNSANATLSAAKTQQQNSADVIAAQMAAAAEIVRTNAQATLNAANSTQRAALTQDAIRQTQVQFNLEMTAEKQNRDEIAAGTQTSVANLIATQTQSAVATSQWYADQSRQREEQRQGPIAFLWMWCLPIFVVLFAGLCLWGFWRWLKIQQNRQRITGGPVEKLQTPEDPGTPQDRFLGRHRLTQPDEQMRGWLDEIKRKLLNREKDKDDNPDR
jgi:hypothetical protein